jgi:DNA-binding transcriptional MerR regulator
MRRKPRRLAQNTGVSETRLPKYTIGIVSQLVGMPPQMLRRYEEAGLLEPARQAGKNRLYSDEDVSVLKEIAELYEQGVNAVGIRHIITMRRQVTVLEQEVNDARQTIIRYEEQRHHFEATFDTTDE